MTSQLVRWRCNALHSGIPQRSCSRGFQSWGQPHCPIHNHRTSTRARRNVGSRLAATHHTSHDGCQLDNATTHVAAPLLLLRQLSPATPVQRRQHPSPGLSPSPFAAATRLANRAPGGQEPLHEEIPSCEHQVTYLERVRGSEHGWQERTLSALGASSRWPENAPHQGWRNSEVWSVLKAKAPETALPLPPVANCPETTLVPAGEMPALGREGSRGPGG